MFSVFLGASASTLLMNQSHLFKEFTPCQWRKIFPLYNIHIFLVCAYTRGSVWIFFFPPSCIFFLLLPSVIPTVVMFSNSFFSICTGESSINQGVADMFSAVLRVSLSLGDMFKLLLSNSGFMFLLPFSVFQGDTGFEIFYFFFTHL